MQQLEDEQRQMDQLKRDLAAEHKSRNNFQMEAERYESSMQRLQQDVVSTHLPIYRFRGSNH